MNEFQELDLFPKQIRDFQSTTNAKVPTENKTAIITQVVIIVYNIKSIIYHSFTDHTIRSFIVYASPWGSSKSRISDPLY